MWALKNVFLLHSGFLWISLMMIEIVQNILWDKVHLYSRNPFSSFIFYKIFLFFHCGYILKIGAMPLSKWQRYEVKKALRMFFFPICHKQNEMACTLPFKFIYIYHTYLKWERKPIKSFMKGYMRNFCQNHQPNTSHEKEQFCYVKN